jgi:mannose-6-phosphate isomerase-like protein (cupin superfamily)
MAETGVSTPSNVPAQGAAMSEGAYATRMLPERPDTVAPDGSHVRILCGLAGGGMAHFTLAAGQVAKAVAHRTVEEIWFIVSGSGEMWRGNQAGEEVTPLAPGVSLTIPLGTRFQFRSLGPGELTAVAVTMPPWPGEGEALLVEGRWQATV